MNYLAGRKCTITAGSWNGVRGIVVDGYPGPGSKCYHLAIEVTSQPESVPPGLVGRVVEYGLVGRVVEYEAYDVKLEPPVQTDRRSNAADMALSACRKIFDASNGGDTIRFAGGLQRDEYGAIEALEAACAAARTP